MKIKLALLTLLTTTCFSFAQNNPAPVTNLCTSKGYTVVYFNGMRSTLKQAKDELADLKQLLGTTWKSEPIKYENFYDPTAGSLKDIAEVYTQHSAEVDAELQSRWEYFWDNYHDNDRSWSDKLAQTFPRLGDALLKLHDRILTHRWSLYQHVADSSVTQQQYLDQETRIKTLSMEGQKLLLIGYSQGNFFANHTYDYIAPTAGANSVGVVHIAPPTTVLHGDYILSNRDAVIDALKVGLSPLAAPDSNITLPVGVGVPDAAFGHSLLNIYLNDKFAGRAKLLELAQKQFNQLQTPTAGASIGAFTITLTWDGTGDVDLHTFEPNGSHSYYASRQGVVGYLDVDNVTSNGPEHYYASCDPAVLQSGTYQIGINNYARATGRTATVQVSSSRGGTLLTKSLGVGAEKGSKGDSSPIPVLNVVVTKDPTTGVFSFDAR